MQCDTCKFYEITSHHELFFSIFPLVAIVGLLIYVKITAED